MDAMRRRPSRRSQKPLCAYPNTFQDDEDEKVSYVVMPFLRLMDSPVFEAVGEIVDFADQILEVCPQ